MIRVSNIKQNPTEDSQALLAKTAKILQVDPEEIAEFTLVKQSVDARKKAEIQYIYTVDVSLTEEKKEKKLLQQKNQRQISAPSEAHYQFPPVTQAPRNPVVVGMGPAGLFSALFMARAGCPPVILERGEAVEQREVHVARFWETGFLDKGSNVQFGEGGAGTFSDGKLTTGTKDPRQRALLQILVEKGAPKDILYSHKPHIGTDLLRSVLKNIRQELLDLGCDIRFSSQMIGLETTGDQISGLRVRDKSREYSLPASHVVSAMGHSARDTFQMFYDAKLPLEPKNFAIGVRIEHLQSDMGFAQYGAQFKELPPTDYKLACHLPSGRSVFSFCVCPGGVVVASSSEEGQVVSNGMSYRQRDGENINGGLLVGVSPADFAQYGGNHPLSGMFFQEFWEKKAFSKGGGDYSAPCQQVGDFLALRPSSGCGKVKPSYRPAVKYTDLHQCLPPEISAAMVEGLPHLGHKVSGFDHPEALLTGIETRSSSPIRISRDAHLQSTLRGFYPCGEGAGYAGGIVSAAVDGIKVAEAVLCQS